MVAPAGADPAGDRGRRLARRRRRGRPVRRIAAARGAARRRGRDRTGRRRADGRRARAARRPPRRARRRHRDRRRARRRRTARAARWRASRHWALRSTAASSRTSPRPESRSRPPSPGPLRTAHRSTAPSTGRAEPPRRSPGAAALLAQMRPALDGPSLESLLVGYAQQGGAPATAVGAGTFRLGASAVGEVAAQPTTLGFGIWQGATGTRPARSSCATSRRGACSCRSARSPAASRRRSGSRWSRTTSCCGSGGRAHPGDRARGCAPAARIVTGVVQIAPAGSEPLRVPWALGFVAAPANAARARRDRPLVVHAVGHRVRRSSPSRPGASCTTTACRSRPSRGSTSCSTPRAASTSASWPGCETCCPGRTASASPGAARRARGCPAGSYELRLAAWPTLPLDAKPDRAQVSFRVE